jgi:hypothetical protein
LSGQLDPPSQGGLKPFPKLEEMPSWAQTA